MTKIDKGEAAFVLFLILWMLAFVLAASSYTSVVKILPLIFGGIGLVLLGLTLAGLFKFGSGSARGGTESRADVGRMIGYMIALWLTAFLLGLLVAITLFVIVFLRREAKTSLRAAVITGSVTGALTVLTLQFMHIDLWAGIVPELIPGYVGGSIMPLL